MPLGKAIRTAALAALVWAACCVGLVLRSGVPEPRVHDEFSYLLGADTFAHGRLVNPPHRLARFFESPHVLVRPTYASKYPPGQALFLALGQRLFGAPYYGVVVSAAAMMFLLTMALLLWCSPGPALAVAAVIGLRFLPPMYFVYSYWGGCVAAAGGAAVLVAVALYRRDQTMWAGVTFSAGLILVFYSRPWEGGVLTAAAMSVAIFGIFRERRKAAFAGGRRFLFGAAPIVALGLAWIGWYNAAVTGNPFEMPYLLHDAQYNVTPFFWFRPLRAEPGYSHPRLALQHGLHGDEAGRYRRVRAAGAWGLVKDTGLSLYGIFGVTLFMLLPLPFFWRDRRIRTLALMLLLALAGLSLDTYRFPHYSAPFTVLVVLLAGCAAGRCWRWHRGSFPLGAVFTSVVFVLAASLPAMHLFFVLRDGIDPGKSFGAVRADLIRDLTQTDAGQLVIVHYPFPGWQLRSEWVYNGADIDSQKIVFAHDRGPKENQELLRYYPSRRPWLLLPSDNGVDLRPY
jgi:hypothetical protein